MFSMKVETAQGTAATRVGVQLPTTDGHLYAARHHDKAFHGLPWNKVCICRSMPKSVQGGLGPSGMLIESLGD